jgi:NodT family efflux transporter outer membrane factor (OMF) lipoprotein
MLALAGLSVGCASPQELEDAEVPDDFSASGSLNLEQRWWQAFEDPALNAIVERALDQNFSLLAAWERLRAARAVVDRENSDRLPTLDVSGGVRTNQFNEGDTTVRPFVGAQASWEVDVWGRIGKKVQAERLRAEATAADAHAASITISAEIALTWARIGAERERLDLIEQQVETNENIMQALRERFQAGSIRAADLLRQQALQEATLQEREDSLARLDVAKNRLAVLIGEAPQYEVVAPASLIDPPPLPQTGVPAELIERRPDVRSEYLRLQAADADLASTARARFPRLNLAASVTTGGASAERIFRDWATSFAATLLQPIFRGGELNAEVDRTEAVRQELFYTYQQVILEALQDVEDALAVERRRDQQVERIRTRIELTERALQQLRVSYQNGGSNFLDVLTSLTELQTLRRTLVDARLARVEQRIALYRALAGPIEDNPLEEEGEATDGGGTADDEAADATEQGALNDVLGKPHALSQLTDY